MLPKAGNAFAQQKELERQRKFSEASHGKASSLEPQLNTDPIGNGNASLGGFVDVPGSPQTTFTMFLQRTGNASESPSTQHSRDSDSPNLGKPAQRSFTDPLQSASLSHLSALPEPLFTANQGSSPLIKFVSKLDAKSKESIPAPAPPTLSKKALEVLGGEVKGKSSAKSSLETRKTLRKSHHDPYPLSPCGSEAFETHSSPRQSVPNPTKRWLIENQRSSQPPPQSQEHPREERKPAAQTNRDGDSFKPQGSQTMDAESPKQYSPQVRNTDGIILGNSSLSPTRAGTYATTHTAQLVDKERIASKTASIVHPSPKPAKHQGPPMARTPSPLSARAYPYDQRTYDERYLDLSSTFPCHASFQSQLSPTSCYTDFPNPGPWERMQRSFPGTMPAFSPSALSFQMDLEGLPSAHPTGPLNSLYERSYPSSQSASSYLADPESTPKGPPRPAQASTGNQNESDKESSDIGSIPIKYSHSIPVENFAPISPAFSESQPSPSATHGSTSALEQLVTNEFATLRASLKSEFSILHRRIDATNSAVRLTTRSLDLMSASFNSLSKGVQLDVHSLRTAQESLRDALQHDFEALDKAVKESEQAVEHKLHEGVGEMVEKYMRPMHAKMQQQDLGCKLKKPTRASVRLADHPAMAPATNAAASWYAGESSSKKKDTSSPLMTMNPMATGQNHSPAPPPPPPPPPPPSLLRPGARQAPPTSTTTSGRGNEHESGNEGKKISETTSPGVSGTSISTSPSMLGGAWLRQAESMGGY